jgi:DNA replication ATP-dependent helicase Dna2
MDQPENILILHQNLMTIKHHEVWTPFQKNKVLFELFTLILEEATSADRINFTTLFSRLAYVGARFQLSGHILHLSHVFRKGYERGLIRKDNEEAYVSLGLYACSKLLQEIWQIDAGSEFTSLLDEVSSKFSKKKEKIVGFRPVVEAVLFEVDTDKKHLMFYDDADPDAPKAALYDVHDKNEIFNANVDSLCKTFTMPIHINLIDVEIRDDGKYVPSALIVQPDHLVDVTAITECFKDFGTEPFLYLISKFKPSEVTSALLTGNLVNQLLDELITNPDIDFNSLLPSLFRSQPLGWALMDDAEVVDVVKKLKDHFKNLKFAVVNEFNRFGINRQNIFLEPSFYSRDYGIQGRLDLLHQKEGKPVYDIVELKSGKTFKPNVYGINAGHYIQTLLYDLMIRSVFQTRAKSFNYILYSKESDKPMRFAPPVKTQQYEAMKLRNDLLAIEQKLKQADIDNSILNYIKPDNFLKLKGFNQKDVENFYNIYSTLNEFEKAYFDHFSAFIAREQSLAKTGVHGLNKSNGHASMWLESDEEKKERFELLSGLIIHSNLSHESDPYIKFSRDKNDFTLVNYRCGDIAVLYPMSENQNRPVLKNQVFKCTITEIDSEHVVIKLRNRQYNQTLFEHNNLWCLELDSLDSGFNHMYKNLFLWAAAPLEYRLKLSGLAVPRLKEGVSTAISNNNEMTPHQSDLLNKMISSRDYFLLWGPPGTGKTSVMLKNLVKHLHENTNENILLLAYTNRAVDEICEAVMSIDDTYANKYLRIGSRLSTHEKFSPQLLDQQVRSLKTRHEILQLLREKRIYVSTVSSITGKTDLFLLKEFETVIIDEASQILEPMLAGILSKFKRWILIGDHKQLPAVVTQDGADSKIKDEKLLYHGFGNTRTSMFERIFNQIKKQGWEHAYGILHQQGRMHQDLMEFPNKHFYENNLALLPDSIRQTVPAFFSTSDQKTKYLLNRKNYFDTSDDQDINWKTNIHEAHTCVEILKDLIHLYKLNKMELGPASIGIITPYRAQIALIRKCMEVIPDKYSKLITVDTVERYQGGARDIIIISFCINRANQLDSLVSMSQEGIDRKLNVALTRAKEQIILIGNKNLLSKSSGHRDLIDHFASK